MQPDQTVTDRRRRGARRALVALAALAGVAVLVAGCGGGSTPGVANVSSSTSTGSPSPGRHPTQTQVQQAQQDAIRFAHCMRSHGVANFPDPNFLHGIKIRLTPSTVGSPAFQAATAACEHLLPRGGTLGPSQGRGQTQTIALLAFAHCLRSHGVPNFPDPTSTGELTHEMLAKAGIDVHDLAVVRAADTCAGVTDGVITKAVIARFVAGR